ncbi:hypothetical protein [Actinomadura sp. GTD37]|uniref:hypothetical protein n=1 Tax=Actinomadura sp. GTD37 TaxID=1778030 RepID=UPI0035BEDDEF
MARPDRASIELPGEGPRPVTPQRLDGTDRIAEAQPRIAKYQSKSGRRYPVVRLTGR